MKSIKSNNFDIDKWSELTVCWSDFTLFEKIKVEQFISEMTYKSNALTF
jgi:hypothetical protein